jgi:hypothetical protein
MTTEIKVRKSPGLKQFEENFALTLGEMQDNPEGVAEFMTKPQGNPITPGQAVISAAKWSEKMIARANAAGQDWLDGVLNPSRDPVAAAIKAAPKYIARMQESLAQKKWEKSMAKVDSSIIAAVAQKVGTAGYTNGINARADKIANVIADLQPRVAALKASVLNMPDVSDADRENRMLAAKRGMQLIGKARRGL